MNQNNMIDDIRTEGIIKGGNDNTFFTLLCQNDALLHVTAPQANKQALCNNTFCNNTYELTIAESTLYSWFSFHMLHS